MAKGVVEEVVAQEKEVVTCYAGLCEHSAV